MRPLYIFDIDGTLANLEHRLHHIQGDNKDWDMFHGNVSLDAPISTVIGTCQMLSEFCEIWFFTGRMSSCRDETEYWLERHVIPKPFSLEMRPTGDYRKDTVVKQEMYDRMLTEDQERLVAVFDDRQGVVDMWRSNDVMCFQCAKGNY
jgi:hypothetical protein